MLSLPTPTSLHTGLVSTVLAVSLAACQQPAPDNPELSAALTAPFDYYINDMRSYRYSANGELLYVLNAANFKHFPGDDHAELSMPDLRLLEAGATTWSLSANKGQLQRNTTEDDLQLHDSVVLRNHEPDQRALTAQTEQMQLLLTSKQARSTVPVLVTSAIERIQSTGGLQADLTTNHLQFLAKVTGSYAQQP